MSAEQAVLRWGGLAGMLGPVLVVVSIIILATFAPASPPAPCGRPCYVDVSIAGFPAAKVAISVAYAGYLAAIILLVVFLVALSRALRPVRLAPSLFGSILGLRDRRDFDRAGQSQRSCPCHPRRGPASPAELEALPLVSSRPGPVHAA